MSKLKTFLAPLTAIISGLFVVQQATAAIALDRTRVIFNGDSSSMSLNVSNENKELPYLAQGWIEDVNGKKIDSPLVMLPPIQRVEPGAKSQVKIQSGPAIAQLPQDRESLYYFNLREIPPKSNKPNTLQIALQTRIKLFYRPKALMATQNDYANPWQTKVTLTRVGDKYQINNVTPYYFTVIAAASSSQDQGTTNFEPFMVDPKSTAMLKGSASALGNTPVLTYINDFGGRPKLEFQCSTNTCTVKTNIPG